MLYIIEWDIIYNISLFCMLKIKKNHNNCQLKITLIDKIKKIVILKNIRFGK